MNSEYQEVYEFIGELALLLYSKRIKVSYGTLICILENQSIGSEQDKKQLWSYGDERGMGSGVSAAYHYWERKNDKVIPQAICFTYTDKDGIPAWMHYEKNQ